MLRGLPEAQRGNVETDRMHTPLPYSAFPEVLAKYVGAMTVAFQRIEEEVLGLLRAIVPVRDEVLDILLSRNWQVSARLQILKQVSPLCLDDEVEVERIANLVGRIELVSGRRNEIMHAVSHGFNKQTGEVIQLIRKKGQAVGKVLKPDDLELLVNRMYLILEAFDQRQASVEEWDRPFKYWERPAVFWESENSC